MPRVLLDNDPAGADQVSQAETLLGVEQGVQLSQGLEHGVAKAFGALDPKLAPFGGFGVVEGIARQGIGKGGHRPLPVNFSLSAIRFQFVEDPRQLRHLALIEIEFVSQEAQGPAYTQAAATVPSFVIFFDGTFPRMTAGATALPSTVMSERTPGVPPGTRSAMHSDTPSRGG